MPKGGRRLSAVSPTSATARAARRSPTCRCSSRGRSRCPRRRSRSCRWSSTTRPRTAEPPMSPSGYMGNAKAIAMDPACADGRTRARRACASSTRRRPTGAASSGRARPTTGATGPAAWTSTGAKTLSFWARGDQGGEVVTFEFGILGRDKAFFDTGHGKLDKVDAQARVDAVHDRPEGPGPLADQDRLRLGRRGRRQAGDVLPGRRAVRVTRRRHVRSGYRGPNAEVRYCGPSVAAGRSPSRRASRRRPVARAPLGRTGRPGRGGISGSSREARSLSSLARATSGSRASRSRSTDSAAPWPRRRGRRCGGRGPGGSGSASRGGGRSGTPGTTRRRGRAGGRIPGPIGP